MTKVKIDAGKIEGAVSEAFKDTCFLLGQQFTQSISDPKWDWITDPTPRDIVDTGRLRASQMLEFSSPTTAQFSWNTDYALYVLMGYTLRNGKQAPPRDWIADGLALRNPQQLFAKLLMARLR